MRLVPPLYSMLIPRMTRAPRSRDRSGPTLTENCIITNIFSGSTYWKVEVTLEITTSI